MSDLDESARHPGMSDAEYSMCGIAQSREILQTEHLP